MKSAGKPAHSAIGSTPRPAATQPLTDTWLLPVLPPLSGRITDREANGLALSQPPENACAIA